MAYTYIAIYSRPLQLYTHFFYGKKWYDAYLKELFYFLLHFHQKLNLYYLHSTM